MSPVPWLMVTGLVLVWSFLHWEGHMVAQGKEPLVDPQLLRNGQLGGGLTMFFFQYLLQMGVFFLIPLYLSVALGLSAIATGVRIMPLSLTLLATALGIPRRWRQVVSATTPRSSQLGVPVKGLPRAAVELCGDLVKLDLAARSQVELARQVLA
jgi:hypothetical protein